MSDQNVDDLAERTGDINIESRKGMIAVPRQEEAKSARVEATKQALSAKIALAEEEIKAKRERIEALERRQHAFLVELAALQEEKRAKEERFREAKKRRHELEVNASLCAVYRYPWKLCKRFSGGSRAWKDGAWRRLRDEVDDGIRFGMEMHQLNMSHTAQQWCRAYSGLTAPSGKSQENACADRFYSVHIRHNPMVLSNDV